jgi:glycosyltransferase involved in cell wall biosynthesis
MTLTDRKPVIVSLTPLALSADSRTLKQATSVHRFGFQSIVVEGKPSLFAQGAMPFELITVGARVAEAAQTEANEKKSGSTVSPVGAARDVQSLSILRHSSFGQFVLRIPGSRRVARAVQRSLYQAIVSLGSADQAPERPSARQIVLAVPYATLLLAKEIVRRLRATGIVRSVVIDPLAFTRYLAEYLNQYVFQVLSVAPRADIYYLHAFYQFPAVFILCLRHRAKMIYDAHDFYSQLEDDASYSSYWKNWIMPFYRAVEWACVRFADDVVTVNEGIAALMRERFGCEPLILRNVHDLRLDREPARTIRETIGLPPEAFLVVSIGNWKMGMAMQEMFDALAGLPRHVHLAFLGGGYPPLDDSIAAHGLEGRIHVLKPVLPQEVVPFIASADASVVLYYDKSIDYQYALPNRFFQSIAAELPLVYPNLSEIRRLADRYGLGIMVDTRNSTEIKSALQELIEADDRRTAMRRNLAVASRELCWEGEERVLRRLFRRHLGIAETSSSALEEDAIG